MKISDAVIVAALAPPRGQAAFDRAPVIVRSSADSDSYLQVSTYLADGTVEGQALSRAELEALLAAAHAIEIAPPRAALTGTALWILRRQFTGRDVALRELETSGSMVCPRFELPDGSTAALVSEQGGALDLRDRWAQKADDEAMAAARSGDWAQARVAAGRAFVLERELSAPRLAMLVIACERTNGTARARAYEEMARRSRGDEFAAAVNTRRVQLEQDIATVSASRRRPKHIGAMQAKAVGHHLGSQKRIDETQRAAAR